jgi:hypothetical protein
METAKLTVAQLKKFAQDEKQKGERARANVARVRKSADELSRAAKAVAEISKKNPEL